MFPLICSWTNGWTNNRDAGDLRRHRAHYDVTVMVKSTGPRITTKSQQQVIQWWLVNNWTFMNKLYWNSNQFRFPFKKMDLKISTANVGHLVLTSICRHCFDVGRWNSPRMKTTPVYLDPSIPWVLMIYGRQGISGRDINLISADLFVGGTESIEMHALVPVYLNVVIPVKVEWIKYALPILRYLEHYP